MTQSQDSSDAKTRFDGRDLRRMFSEATRLFESNVRVINALNVFPVPDGDTGTNMFLTLRDVVEAAEATESQSAGEVASAMARGALMGARGNSGVILSQLFKGMAVALEGKRDFGTRELGEAFDTAREYAYKAVGEPVEGTLLTVISGVAKAAQESAASGSSLQEALDALCAAAAEAVALTPTMLPVLHDAGVVDAGGHGLSVILEGLRTYATGDEVHLGELQVPAPVGVEVSSGAVSQQFLEATDEEMYGYCTQFLIRGSDMNTEAIRERMASLALSTAVVGDDTMVKVHVHAHDPGPIVSFAVSLGTLSQVKIENMDDQHREYSAARLRAAPDGAKDGAVPIAVVVVASGQGLATVFTDLGAAFVLSGGDTMNPSVQDILNAVESVPSENVILLPNNGNIVPAAKQAIELSEKRLRVIPASTIPEGIAAMLAFNPENDLDDNESEMLRMLPSVRTGEICRAVRPVELNGIAVEEGRIIGLIGRELVAAGGEPNEVLVSLLREAEIAEGELVTLYWGDPLSQEIADAGRRRVEAAFSGAEVEVVAGGQPYYHYIVSIE